MTQLVFFNTKPELNKQIYSILSVSNICDCTINIMQSDQAPSNWPNFDNLNNYLGKQVNCELYLFIIDEQVITPLEYNSLLCQTYPITVICNSFIKPEYKYLVSYNKMVINNVFKIHDMSTLTDPFDKLQSTMDMQLVNSVDDFSDPIFKNDDDNSSVNSSTGSDKTNSPNNLIVPIFENHHQIIKLDFKRELNQSFDDRLDWKFPLYFIKIDSVDCQKFCTVLKFVFRNYKVKTYKDLLDYLIVSLQLEVFLRSSHEWNLDDHIWSKKNE